MQFADPSAGATAYLILRHLYDGDVIEWPIADDHPLRGVFAQLEAEGYVARWDRVWPLHDRYRLTEKGIATIEAVYRPAGSEAFFDELRRANLNPAGRRGYLQTRGFDPNLWPLLHDPSTHWSTYQQTGARYHAYVWEDHRPARPRRPPANAGKGQGGVSRVIHHHHDDDYFRRNQQVPYLVDLDRPNDNEPLASPATPDYDVS